jgi:hypothetical protein
MAEHRPRQRFFFVFFFGENPLLVGWIVSEPRCKEGHEELRTNFELGSIGWEDEREQVEKS